MLQPFTMQTLGVFLDRLQACDLRVTDINARAEPGFVLVTFSDDSRLDFAFDVGEDWRLVEAFYTVVAMREGRLAVTRH